MALTRKLLKSFSLEESVIDSIIEAHLETLEPIKKERDEAKQTAESTQSVTKERDELKQKLEALEKASGDAARVQADFDAYKKQVEGEKTNATKVAAAKAVLKKAGVQREEFLELLMGKIDFEKVEIDGETIKDAENVIVKPLKSSYEGCFGSVKPTGTPKVNPPTGKGGSVTISDIAKMTDRGERRQAIMENINLFEKE